MRFGLDLPPHFRVFGGFFIYSLRLGSLVLQSLVLASALGRKPVIREVTP
jgi:hypothetical protein